MQWSPRPAADAGSANRLGAYWSARNQFIDSGRAVRPLADPTVMLDQVQGPLLTVLRLGEAVATTDAGRARLLLGELAAPQPARIKAIHAQVNISN